MREEFDFDVALAALQDGQGLTGKDGILTPLVKQLTEAALQAELEAHLKADKSSNRRNGAGRKTIKSTSGSFELATPRDRAGSFEPREKTPDPHERRDRMQDYFNVRAWNELSGHRWTHLGNLAVWMFQTPRSAPSLIRLIPEIKLWQQRPLDSHYPFVWLDAIHYKVKQDGRTQPKRFTRFWGLILRAGRKFLACIYLKPKVQTSGSRC